MRIGVDRLAGAAVGTPEDLAEGRELGSYPVTDFAGLAQAMAADDTLTVLDSRRGDERVAGGVRGSLHIPIHELATRIDEVPAGEVWVYCGSGYRASIAASMLVRAGREPVLVNGGYGDPDTGAATVGLDATPPWPDRPGLTDPGCHRDSPDPGGSRLTPAPQNGAQHRGRRPP